MKYTKNYKFSKCVITSTLLTAGIASVVVPGISNSNATSAIQTASEKIQTGNIIHSTDTQVVNNVNDIQFVGLGAESVYGYSAIVNNNGAQEYYVWGYNIYGQLGLGHRDNVTTPTKFDLSVFGDNYISLEIHFAGYDSDSSYAIVNTVDGQKLFTWGLNSSGQLGIGFTTYELTPQLVSISDLGFYDSIESVNISSYTTYVITKKAGNQFLYVTGSNIQGELGNGTTTNTATFIPVPTTALGNYLEIVKFNVTHSTIHMIVRTNTGLKLYVWGRNTESQIGNGGAANVTRPWLHTNTIFNASDLAHLQIRFGLSSYALNKVKNELYVWGQNTNGQLGINTIINQTTPSKVTASSFGGGIIKDLSISISSYALVEIGNETRIYMWGYNAYGQLGLNDTTQRNVPQRFDLAQLGNPKSIKKLSLGLSNALYSIYTSYALVESVAGETELFLFGRNNYGQLNTGNTTDASRPQKIILPSDNMIIDASAFMTTFITTITKNGDIEIFACGRNTEGQLGLNNISSTTKLQKSLPIFPTQVTVAQSFDKTQSSHDALNEIKTSVLQDPTYALIKRYLNITNLPSDAKITVHNDSKFNARTGTIDLAIVIDKTNEILSSVVVTTNKRFDVTIDGFKIVNDIENAPVVSLNSKVTGLTANKFYESISNAAGIVHNRSLLAEYIDLSAIPADANLSIKKNAVSGDYKLDFQLTTDKVYTSGGLTTNRVETYNVLVELPSINLGLVVGVPIASVALITMIIVGVILYKKYKSKYRLVY